MSEARKVLEIFDVSKSFSGIKVFSDFDFDLYAGEANCLCGENGAGKSTFIKILSGAYQPDSGRIIIDGKEIKEKLNPRLSSELGIQTVYQEHTYMPHMKVFENLFIGNEIMKRGSIDRKAMIKRTLEIFDNLGISGINPNATVNTLSSAQQKFVEIAKAFIKKAKIMIMDEPTSSFSVHEVEQLKEVIKNLKEEGVGIIYISHHLEEVFSIADRVTILRDGRKISTYDKKVAEFDEAQIIRDMVGRDASEFYNKEKAEIGEEVFRVENLSGPGVNDVSFYARKGEIVGFSGLVGAGRTEMAELIMGAVKKTSGKIFVNGKEVKNDSPAKAIKNGINFLHEDRQMAGLCVSEKISLNTILANTSKQNMGFISPKYDFDSAKKYIDELKTKCTGPNQNVNRLSGGNQQKVAFSKWLLTDGEVYIFDEPTRGVDVGAKQDIYHLMTQLAKNGKAIVMLSSDMPEVISMSDRVYIMKDSRIVAEVTGDEIEQEKILDIALGGTTNE